MYAFEDVADLSVYGIEIASDGNGVDFGDSADHFASGIGASDCHGGLGGY